MNAETLNIMMLNGMSHHHEHASYENASSSLELVQESSSSGTLDSGNNTSSSVSSNVTTLELHPNVILGIPEDEDPVTVAERPHMCTICHASYKTRTHLRRHMFIHMSSRPFPCPECGKGFNRKEHLNKHLEAVHSGTKHNCPYCDKEISRLDHLKRHIKNMHGNVTKDDKAAVLKVQLPCGQKQKAQLSFLTPSFPPGTIGQTIITPIPLSATSIDKLSRVKYEPHDGTLSPASMDEDTAPSMTIIPSNILGPGQGVATLAIQSIGSSVPTQKVLVHQRHPTGSSVNLSAATNGLAEKDLSIHARTHKLQPYRCPDCPRAYTRREKLTEHIRCVHQGQKFRCDYCGKELSRKDHVLRHIRSVHPEVYAGSFAEMADNDIVIDQQGRLVSRSSTMSQLSPSSKPKRSLKNTTINIPSIGDVGVLLRSVCHVCLKVFGTAYHLTRHIESCHNGDVRPFSCTACNKMFKRKDHLTKHMKSHCPNLKDGVLSQQITSPCSSTSKSRISPSRSLSKSEMQSHQGMDNEADLGMLSEGSTSSDCHHTILQNLQVELRSGEHSSHAISSSTTLPSQNSGVQILDGGDQKHSNPNEFSLAVIDSFMQGNLNVVVVDEEISNFLQQSSSSHLTTTFPCGQCQKEFPARDQLIAHLQEHANESIMQNDQHISDISFSDF
ncbi:putative zinc finger protein [Orchesella cincta]|uniref:Putative zinc finger protein n=1 Tax=Orchesella cincta TaxID=48709 RepID=A0A1D2N3B1_ORCCI|nr:putative zinc finger protein [Orchesella cincta]